MQAMMAILMAMQPSIPTPTAMPAAEACATIAEPTGELAGWATPVPLTAAVKPADAARTVLVIGQRADVVLTRTSDMRYVTQPEKPGGSVSYGGLVSFVVPAAATYRVALASGAWIDVLSGKTPVVSVAHGHGPDCTGIRKMVDFLLKPGRYTLQIAANGQPMLGVMVARLP